MRRSQEQSCEVAYMNNSISTQLRQFLVISIGMLIPMCLFSANDNIVEKRGYYDKHIIIAIQQNSLNGNDGRRDAIYDAICCILKNQKITNTFIDFSNSDLPHNFSFNPTTDKISLYSFGFSESVTATWDDFIKKHFTYLSSYPDNEQSFESFIENNLNAALLYHDSRFAFAYYTDPLILTKLNKEGNKSRAKEYYLFIVSPFLAGSAKTSSEYDPIRIKDFAQLASKLKDEHIKINRQIGRQDNVFDIWTKDTSHSNLADRNNSLKLRGHKIVLRALSDVDVYCRSTIELSQVSFGSKKYEMGPQKIAFVKNDLLRLDSIILSVSDGENNFHFSNLTSEWIENEHDSFYEVSVPGNVIELKRYDVGDQLQFNYSIFATSLNEDDRSELLSFVIDVPKVDFVFTPGVFPLAPSKLYFMIAIILLLIAIILFCIWYYRGRLVKAHVNVKIDNISKQRYMNINTTKDDGIHVTNASCWYLRPGINEQRIHVRCSMQREKLTFAKKYRIKLSYMVKDLDENHDFTFGPEGQENDGSMRKVDVWYAVPEGPFKDEIVEFEFNAIAYIDHGKQPDFIGRENMLKLGICLKAELINKAGIVVKLLDELNDVPYEFIAKEYFPNRELWLALDPGTSGSCIAYGYGGRVVSRDNIHLARNFAKHTDGTQGWEPIFPSKIKISDNSSLFTNPTGAESARVIEKGGDGDFWFGNDAEQLWGRNSFQSIKKLLGYSNELLIKREKPVQSIQRIAGRDLAHLLVKGLLNRFMSYLSGYSGGDNGTNDVNALNEVLPKFFNEGEFQPSRAIVTVPNNFTLVKILDMVESVRRTNKFKEVHFLYEAEGVLMMYLRENWSELKKKEAQTIIVFDMGGATINASAFNIRTTMREYNGQELVDDVTVKTISRIGYGIGGDDIDFALIQIIFSIPSVKKTIKDTNRFILEHKKMLLKYITSIKLSYIDKATDRIKAGNIVSDMETLWGSLRTNFKEWGVILPENFEPEDDNYIKREQANHRTIKKYVLDNVDDAVAELINSGNSLRERVEVIFSGRSTLYPGVKETVMKRLTDSGFTVNRWNGFDKPESGIGNGSVILDEEKVKSAVAVGACWYAMWSQYVTIRHDIVTSTFGFIDMKDNKEVFHPVVSCGEDLQNGHLAHEADIYNPTITNIAFVQMLGTNYEEILSKKIYHKMNQIVQLTDIDGDVDKVKIDVDDKNNFTYLVTEKSGISHGGRETIKDVDILDENSEAYIFAAFTNEEDTLSENYSNDVEETDVIINTTAEPVATKKSDNNHKQSKNKRGGGL